MNIDYENNKIKKQLSSATEIKKAFGEGAKKIAIRLSELKAVPNLKVLQQIPSANCHPLSGDRKGDWAVNISPNHRLIFEISHGPLPLTKAGSIDKIKITDITILKSEDYH
ncbi:MAG: hypothetical protein ABIP80_06400 [Ferruginibacter sp.]